MIKRFPLTLVVNAIVQTTIALTINFPTNAQVSIAQNENLSEPAIPQSILNIGKQITVKLYLSENDDYKTSGVLIARELLGKDSKIYKYLILTTGHGAKILQQRAKTLGKNSYQVQIFDTRQYQAFDFPVIDWNGSDLAVFWFASTDILEAAQIGKSSSLTESEELYIFGYPCREDERCQGKLKVTVGKAYTALIKAKKWFREGTYNIGFSNVVENGMSGGAILTSRNFLVGIVGMQSSVNNPFQPFNPDFNPYQFMDKTLPTTNELNKFRKLGWGVPSEIYIKQLPENPFDKLKVSSKDAAKIESQLNHPLQNLELSHPIETPNENDNISNFKLIFSTAFIMVLSALLSKILLKHNSLKKDNLQNIIIKIPDKKNISNENKDIAYLIVNQTKRSLTIFSNDHTTTTITNFSKGYIAQIYLSTPVLILVRKELINKIFFLITKDESCEIIFNKTIESNKCQQDIWILKKSGNENDIKPLVTIEIDLLPVDIKSI